MTAVGPKAFYITEPGWFWSTQRRVSEAEFKAHQVNRLSGFSLQGIIKTIATGILAATQSVRMGDRTSSLGQQVAFLSLGQLVSSQFYAPSAPFQVNTIATGDQQNPQIAEDATTGNFMITWANVDTAAENGNGWLGIYGQVVDPTGKMVGSQIQINNPSFSYLTSYNMIALNNVGRFAVVWDYILLNSNVSNVVGQLYDSNGRAVGTGFQVGAMPDSSQSYPIIAPTQNGFFAGWLSEILSNGTGMQYQQYSYGQQFSNMGIPIGSPFTISGTGLIASPVGNSSFIIGWHPGGPISVQGISQTGPTGPAVSSILGPQGPAGQAAPIQGGFVVVWNELIPEPGIGGQLFNESGAPVGTNFIVTDQGFYDLYPFAEGLKGSGGGFIVTWTGVLGLPNFTAYEADAGTVPRAIYGQQCTAEGVKIGNPFLISGASTRKASSSQVAASETGGFMAIWENLEEAGYNSNIYACLYIPGTMPPGVTVPGGNPGVGTTKISQAGGNAPTTTQGVKNTTKTSSGAKINMSTGYLGGALLAFQVARQVMNMLIPSR